MFENLEEFVDFAGLRTTYSGFVAGHAEILTGESGRYNLGSCRERRDFLDIVDDLRAWKLVSQHRLRGRIDLRKYRGGEPCLGKREFETTYSSKEPDYWRLGSVLCQGVAVWNCQPTIFLLVTNFQVSGKARSVHARARRDDFLRSRR